MYNFSEAACKSVLDFAIFVELWYGGDKKLEGELELWVVIVHFLINESQQYILELCLLGLICIWFLGDRRRMTFSSWW